MKFFHILVALSLVAFGALPAKAGQSRPETCDHLCMLNKQAVIRAPHPTSAQLVCANFTLPEPGKKVTIRVSRGDKVVIEDSKVINSREGQFCYPKALWQSAGGEPDKVFFCSEHSVTLPWKEVPVAEILSGRGDFPKAYACLRGIKGCGDIDRVAIPRTALNE